ncbi:peptidylprolyl isomerase [Sandaracinomonas limnophila]|uniref:Peptidylprolyl isomerase n=1 Tax=Sandaracinomonas limnophila TaxID=1862386 RepID=A0A437PXF3_9BACT|nr:peptidylprolyl isomerase [Sandaracinomonas limnophila]RVU26944.1 peptidylprolyl isomerase [Sandaracinomonas limnophila]
MNKIKSIFLFLLCFSLFSAFAQEEKQAEKQGEVLDKIIGKVDNYFVLKSDLELQYQRYLASDPVNTPTRCQLLEGLIINKLLLAKSEIDSVTVEDKRIEQELNSRMEQMENQYGSSKAIVEAFGKSIATLKDDLRGSIKEQLVGRKMQDKITEAIKITPKEVKQFFNSIPTDSLPYLPSEVEVGQIVRLAQPNKEQKQELVTKLNDIKKRVEKGESFEELAKVFSEDLGSGKRGGDLGFAKRGQMVPPFEAAAVKLKPNQMSDVVESEFGFHLIQMLEQRGQEYHARHILLRPDYQKLDLTEPTRFLDSIRVLIQRDTLKFEKAAKEFSEDKATQDAGGMMIDPETRGLKMAFDSTMDPALYFSLDSMKVGTISVPQSYRTDDGRSAMRIIYFKAKHAPHFANLKDDYQKISSIALSRKRNTAIDEWFLKAKEDVFIFVDEEYKDCDILKAAPNQR